MRPSPALAAESFRAIGLAELETAAPLQDRLDSKYVLSLEKFAALADLLLGTHLALEIDGRRAFRYHTTYFDTEELRIFRDHVQGRRRRYKCRTREYVDCGLCVFEIKLKGLRGRTIKHRIAYDQPDRDRVSSGAHEFLRECVERAYGRPPEKSLVPTLAMAYHRITLAAPAYGERVTCDFELAFSARDGNSGRLAPDRVIVETKSAAGRSFADRALRELGARPESTCSKYNLGIGFTHPGVLSNRVRPLLRRHFQAATHMAVAPPRSPRRPGRGERAAAGSAGRHVTSVLYA